MCDTMVALGNSTANGRVLFAKNSDREPNEAHEIVIFPRAKYDAGSMVKCTYIEIPQVEETYQILLAKPFWIWGAEMGSNEFGVTIGNEAVFTKDAYGREPGLIGMDFLRLALERTKSAYQALLLIVELLEKYGQSGNCGFEHTLFYHNSFLICDPDEAWVLETSGKEWAAEKVKDVRTISNAITIDDHWDLASENLVNHAIEKGWCKERSKFSFSRCYSEPVYTLFSDARKRQVCTTMELSTGKGKLTPATMMAILRHHHQPVREEWSPDRGVTGADVCMHSGWGPIRGSQSAGSMVSQIDRSDTVHWVTASSAPCTSIFKPVWLDAGVPDNGPSPDGSFDKRTYFWKHEIVHRNILKDYATRIKLIQPDQQALEDEMMLEVEKTLDGSVAQRRKLSEKFFIKANELEIHWQERLRGLKNERQNRLLYRLAWKTFNKSAKFDFLD